MLASSGATYPSETFIWKGGITSNPVQSDAGYIHEATVHGFTTATYWNDVNNWFVLTTGATGSGNTNSPNGNISVAPAARLPHGGDNVIFRRLENDPANGISGGPWPKNPCLWGGFGYSAGAGDHVWAGSVGTTTDQQLPLNGIVVEESYGVSGGNLGSGWRLGYIPGVDGVTLTSRMKDGITWDGLYLSALYLQNRTQKYGLYLQKFTRSDDTKAYGVNRSTFFDESNSRVWVAGGTTDDAITILREDSVTPSSSWSRDKVFDFSRIVGQGLVQLADNIDSDIDGRRNIFLTSKDTSDVQAIAVARYGSGFHSKANVHVNANVNLLNVQSFTPDIAEEFNGTPVVKLSRNPFTDQATRHTVKTLLIGAAGAAPSEYSSNFVIGCGATIDTLTMKGGQLSLSDRLFADETVEIIKGSVQGCNIDYFSLESADTRLRIGTAGNTFDDGLRVDGLVKFRFSPTTHVRASKGVTGSSDYFRNFEGDLVDNIKQALNLD